MNHRNRHANLKREMNLALDNALPEKAQAVFRSELAQSPHEAHLWENMKTIDRLFSAEPMVEAPLDFASKVMASIAAASAADAAKEPAKQPRGLGAVLWLLLVALIVLPLALLVGLTIQRLTSDPSTLGALLQQIVQLLNTVAQTVATLFLVIADYATNNPVLPLLVVLTIPLVMLWGWFMRYAGQRRQLVVYRIPVQVIG
jgi:ABC-type multidrug transport system fused ATPase/permease subunit